MTEKQADDVIYQLRRIADHLEDLVEAVKQLTAAVRTA